MSPLDQVLDRLDRLVRLTERAVGALEAIAARPATPMSVTGEREQLWTVSEVAEFLRCSTSTVYHRAEAGDLPRLLIGGQLRFEADAVRAHAKGQAPPPARVVSKPNRG